MSIAGIPLAQPNNPSPNQGFVIPIITVNHEPTVADRKYNVGTFFLIGRDPSTGTQGDLWYLSKFDSSGLPVWVHLLTAATSPGIDSITTDDGSPAVEPDVNGNVNIVGGVGCTVTGQGPGNTVTVNLSGGGFDWAVIQDATHTIEVNHGYFADRGAGVAFTLPASANVGDTFSITGINAGGFTIAQNAGQTTYQGTNSSTTGVAGGLTSSSIGDTITLTCAVQDTDFWATVPPQGNITLS